MKNRSLTDKDITEILERQSWTFAKTYSERSPHWWSARTSWGLDYNIFPCVCRYLFHNGEPFPFYGVVFPVFRVNGYRYWSWNSSTPEEKLGTARLINRTIDDDDQLEKVVANLGYKWQAKGFN